MLSVILLSAIMLNVVMLSVVILSVVMLSVGTPLSTLRYFYTFVNMLKLLLSPNCFPYVIKEVPRHSV
jgi:hypothetical protein